MDIHTARTRDYVFTYNTFTGELTIIYFWYVNGADKIH